MVCTDGYRWRDNELCGSCASIIARHIDAEASSAPAQSQAVHQMASHLAESKRREETLEFRPELSAVTGLQWDEKSSTWLPRFTRFRLLDRQMETSLKKQEPVPR